MSNIIYYQYSFKMDNMQSFFLFHPNLIINPSFKSHQVFHLKKLNKIINLLLYTYQIQDSYYENLYLVFKQAFHPQQTLKLLFFYYLDSHIKLYCFYLPFLLSLLLLLNLNLGKLFIHIKQYELALKIKILSFLLFNT